ncbi:NADH-quinone oxidoreductase subunit NuoE [Geomonas sp. Red69]|uniref:NADH-quinone oxidoreductase subunit NuoE n=1 Tax=Geomonas diazotrophica TaxID=2843197 RepID=UPI001C106544|nr:MULTISPECIES: NADH-quinone oxidoreductase subunit NuoE [Geomonas]MBU5635400.1 NADH-quinone oxidoreductase subunit NuoE [Geomonas diazotrophica]QXE86685.1 NADH-quinone oxidoreductase subunit NuoE [Geomonas nitrogeniifigens]
MIPETLKTSLKARVASALTPREAAVDVMKELQAHYGWLTDEAVEEAAALLGLSPLQVEELATFYEMIYRRPVGKKVIHVCDSISCWCADCDKIIQHLKDKLGVGLGGTTADGMFTLIPCCCMGMCGDSPAMSVGGVPYGKLTPELVDEILEMERNNR